jgi:hypothetical protein
MWHFYGIQDFVYHAWSSRDTSQPAFPESRVFRHHRTTCPEPLSPFPRARTVAMSSTIEHCKQCRSPACKMSSVSANTCRICREFWHRLRNMRVGNETNVHRPCFLARRLARAHMRLPASSACVMSAMREPQLPLARAGCSGWVDYTSTDPRRKRLWTGALIASSPCRGGAWQADQQAGGHRVAPG